MNAPYRRMEFTSKSGNHCRLKVFMAVLKDRMAIDVTWDIEPTDDDVAECDAWFPGAAKDRFGLPVAGVFSARIDDEEERNAVVAAFMSPVAAHPERN